MQYENDFLDLGRSYLENKGYRDYFTSAKFVYQNANRMVQSNELMIAFKEKEQ